MSFLSAWWSQLTSLVSQTLRVWWQVLPKIVIAWVAGWLVYRIALTATASIQETHPWLTVVIFSSGLVVQLAAIIIAIRIAGNAAGLWETLPASAARIGRDEPLPKVVSLALLPFVGVYSVFGGIDDATYQLFIQGALQSSTFLNPQSATTVLDPTSARQRWIIGAVLVGSYLLRRGLETAADRTGRWIFGLVGALVEGFFSVVLIFGGSRMLADLGAWLRERVFFGWLMDAQDWLMGLLATLHISIPVFLTWLWQAWTQYLWPLINDAMLAPLLWLAATGLVFGTYVLSASELWEIGGRRGLRSPLARRSRRLARLEDRGLTASQGSRATILELVEIFVGDLEDRIIPFVQSLRHVLRVGLPFMGAFILLYAIASAIQPLLFAGLRALIGGNVFKFWLRVQPPLDLLSGIIGEPLRISLLAVAMTMTLTAGQLRHIQPVAAPSTAQPMPARSASGQPSFAPPTSVQPASVQPTSVQPASVQPTSVQPASIQPAPDGRPSPGRTLVAFVVTLACIVAAGSLARVSQDGPKTDIEKVAPGQTIEIHQGQPMRVVGFDAGTRLEVSGSEQIGLVTEALFLGIDLEMTSHARTIGAIGCQLYSPGADGELVRIDSPVEDGFLTPQLGFTQRVRFVFERPADGLAGSMLHCKPTGFYLAFEPEVVFDLGIDDRLQTELAAKNGLMVVGEPVVEVAR